MQAVARRLPIAENVCRSREFSFLKYFLHRTGKIINIIISIGIGRSNEHGKRKYPKFTPQSISAANRLIGEVVQSRRRPLLGPSPG